MRFVEPLIFIVVSYLIWIHMVTLIGTSASAEEVAASKSWLIDFVKWTTVIFALQIGARYHYYRSQGEQPTVVEG